MPSLDQVLKVYQELADWHEQHGPPQVRDRFLILAADAALSAGREDEADRLRRRLLQLNPHHLLRPFASLAEALRSPDVRNYINDLRQNYPFEVAQEMRREIQEGNPAGPRETIPLPPTLPVVDINPPEQSRPDTTDPVVVYWDDTEVSPAPLAEPAPLTPLPSSPAGGEGKGVKGPNPMKRPPAAKPPPPARTAPAPQPGKWARLAATRRETYPLRPDPAPAPEGGRKIDCQSAPHPGSQQPSDPDEDESPRAVWVASVLFGLTLTAGVGLTIYTLIRPFLPPQWLL